MLEPGAADVRIAWALLLEAEKRPVSAVADFTEVRDVVSVSVFEDRNISLSLMFDPEHNLEERITSEQFSF